MCDVSVWALWRGWPVTRLDGKGGLVFKGGCVAEEWIVVGVGGGLTHCD